MGEGGETENAKENIVIIPAFVYILRLFMCDYSYSFCILFSEFSVTFPSCLN